MKHFDVKALNVERLHTMTVEAKDFYDAEEKYAKLWEEGQVGTKDSELIDFETQEVSL